MRLTAILLVSIDTLARATLHRESRAMQHRSVGLVALLTLVTAAVVPGPMKAQAASDLSTCADERVKTSLLSARETGAAHLLGQIK